MFLNDCFTSTLVFRLAAGTRGEEFWSQPGSSMKVFFPVGIGACERHSHWERPCLAGLAPRLHASLAWLL
eukprot:jgi/Botrbrau1/13028/Bobra.0389s0019.1